MKEVKNNLAISFLKKKNNQDNQERYPLKPLKSKWFSVIGSQFSDQRYRYNSMRLPRLLPKH